MTPTVKLHLGDCLEFLRTLEPGSVDAVVTDPPYGMNALDGSLTLRHGVGRRKNWDCSPIPREAIDAMLGIGKPLIMWGANYYCGLLPPHKKFLVWNKPHLAHMYNYSAAELAFTNLPGPAKTISMCADADKQHPAQKPVALMMWCLEILGLKPGMTVFDPYAGSGTTGVACVRAGLNFIGCEIDPDHHALAMKRIGAAVEHDRRPLFDPRPVQAELFIKD